MKTIRWGMIGAGDVTEVKSGPALYKAEGSALVMVMRRTGSLAQDYARRHGIPRWTVDAVYIATPPDSHMMYAQAVAAAGKPVYVEKPMGRTYAECEAMLEACRVADVPLFVAYYRRALPRFLHVKRLLEEGAIGKPRYVTMALCRQTATDLDPEHLPWRYVPAIAGGGLFMDLASHTLDLLDYLLGRVITVEGGAANQGGLYAAEDIITGRFVFESGAQGVGTWCFTAYERCDQIEIVGTRGKLSFACFEEEPIVLHTAEGATPYNIPNPPHIQQPLIETIIGALNGVGACPSTGENAARTNRVMDTLLAEYRAAHGQP
jgi:1,5-anhydro-D-fructose reductase (1,5-anhydro-D-mannitol-forming)